MLSSSVLYRYQPDSLHNRSPNEMGGNSAGRYLPPRRKTDVFDESKMNSAFFVAQQSCTKDSGNSCNSLEPSAIGLDYRRGIHQWRDTMLVRSIVVVAALVAGGSAFAQGVSDKTPGHKMQGASKSTAPGASEYAPGHKMQNAKKSTAPGASEYAPGRQQPTGSNTKR